MTHIITDAQWACTDHNVPFTAPTTHRSERRVTPNWLRALYALIVGIIAIVAG